jgi:TldD protein
VKELLEEVRDKAQARGVQFMDARLFAIDSTDVSVQDGKADKVGHRTVSAVGVRVLVDDAWGYASTEAITAKSLDESLTTAIEMARMSSSRVAHAGVVADVTPNVDTVVATVEHDPRSVPLEEKVRRISAYEAAGVGAGNGKITNSMALYGDRWSREVVCNTFGTLVDQQTIRTRIVSLYTASDGTTRQTAFKGFSEQAGFELLDRVTPGEFTELAATQAVDLLSADRCPSGKFPVVLDQSVTGLFTHEVLGHNAEADEVFNGLSIISDKMGERIASDHVTIVDDATMPRLSGSYAYDSEGMPGQQRTIIDKGVLTGFMHSLETASRFGVAPNGSGRAQDAHSMPIVRMSNTYMLPGEQSLDDLVGGIDEGLLIQDSRGGYVYPERGQYTCMANCGRMIRNGELAEPVREITFSGMTLDTLMDIDAVSSDLEYDPGMCGKGGQGMYVTDGGAHVRVKEVVVGGQE